MIKIVKMKGISVYPIFKNGHSSIVRYANDNKCKWLLNERCDRTNPITVFLRKPHERFISGVHTYIEHERRKLLVEAYTRKIQDEDFLTFDYEPILKKIEQGEITNEHFMPQYIWLKKLHQYYNGIVILKTVNDLRMMIDNRDGPNIPDMSRARRQRIAQIDVDLREDNILYNKYIGAHIPLGTLMKQIEHVLS